MLKEVFAWECRTGCGHMTYLDKDIKRGKPYCANCGTRETMEFQGVCTVSNPKLRNVFDIIYGKKK
jgi:hypothetical protein